MRLKKGSKVEVLSTEEVATGSWRCAEIVTGNGRTYTLKHSRFQNTTSEILEKVPRMAIRPSPPPLEGLDNWAHGDLVEVFHNLSWKTAIVVDVLDGNYYLVRLLGLTKEFEVQKSQLRVRQSWENGTWFIVGQGSTSYTMPKGQKNKDTRTEQCATDDNEIQNLLTFSTRRKKRSSFGSSYNGSCNRAAQKMRVIDKDDSFQRLFLENAYDSCASSVASCSANSIDVHDSPFPFTKHCKEEDTNILYSDAESFCGRGYAKEDYPLPKTDKLLTGVHRSALHAYRCVIEALYASGPLTWEEELKMSNLRHSLHISDDEHLMLLRNLIAT